MFEMKKEYLIGIEIVDNQHFKILSLLSMMSTANTAQEPAAVHKALQEMMEYSIMHFSTERQLMEQDGYPESAAHLGEHKTYVKLLQEKVSRHLAGDELHAEELIAFLRDWWINHIMQTDLKWGTWHNHK